MSEEWACESCTFINAAKDRVCTMCSRSRPKPKVEAPKMDYKAAPVNPHDLQAIQANSLSKFASLLWGTGRFSDVTLNIVKGSESKSIPCHKIILCSLSPVFNKLFDNKENDKKDEKNETQVVEIKDFKVEDVQNFIKAFYTGQVEVTEGNFEPLSQLADRYDVPVVRTACGSFIESKLTLETALKYYSRSGIGVDYVARNAGTLFKSSTDAVLSLPLDKFRRLIESDELALDEIDVFRYVYRWGREELKRKKKDKESSTEVQETKDEIQDLQQAIEELIPHVRLPLMSSEQLGSVVMPSKVIDNDKLIAIFTYVAQPREKKVAVKQVQGFSARPRKALNPRELAKRTPSFFATIQGMDDPFSMDKKYQAFDHYDTDRDGKLSQSELRVVVYHLCEFMLRMFQQEPSDSEAQKVIRLAEDPTLADQIAALIEVEMNITPDGFITRTNFCENLSRTVETAMKTTLGMQD